MKTKITGAQIIRVYVNIRKIVPENTNIDPGKTYTVETDPRSFSILDENGEYIFHMCTKKRIKP